jgi:predicted hotdog family 3-hydroxylacyl-ACP dehydratase
MTFEELQARPVLELLPHAAPMALLSRTAKVDEEGYEAEVDVHAGSLFCGPQGVPAWVGIEYMAQAIAAFAGAEALRRGEGVKVGFLLGSREYHCSLPYFKVGSTLSIRVKKVIHDPSGLSVVECRLGLKGEAEPYVVSNLTVYEVPSLSAYLKENVK